MHQRDPVCGMTVESDTAVGASHGSQNYYFCSTACRDRFRSNPVQYLGASAAASDQGLEKHEPPHTTKGGVTSPKFGSAGSGGAEYERLPEQHDN